MDLEFQLLPEPQVQTRWRRTLQLLGAEYMSFYDLVRNVSKIGGGNFSQVYQGTYWLTGEEVIIKAVEKKRLQQANALTEILVLRSVSHPSIVSFRGAFQNQKTVILITEYLRGGDLFDFIKRNGRMSERDSRDAMEKILQALVTLHARGIVHRDLKTENVMLRNPFDGTSVCLIDFGLSATLDSELMTMRCGSPGYVAPEVLLEKGKYNSKCDVFSAGVVLYTMLTGKPPFRGEDAKCILKKNARAKIVFPDYLSEEVKSLISWMTQRRPELRCSTQDALQHPFFTHESLPHGPFISHNGEDTCLQLPKHILSQDHKFYFDRMSPNTTAVI
ncbi:putative serine/threonine-protein kinase [Gregarina niphandrodes]|uniref:Serine/threonine-protein kinase n=1 Tax=Gregarina niphandrodes TaxID=110365 RepID=A0A023B979_GRENI|nr:putative serine/threonine-protein kinase [Gregarina niphandrodes]EZG71442.1 putative serine/threonine-protein kinase [Gregarina niphandrodes]|eukprot:XP_011129827.1 putative serine/threonine-protein kinase [Gregarina niphandrodes]